MEPSSKDDFDVNLESTVLLTLSRLQKKNPKKKHRNIDGVPCKKVVDFLKANYSWVDGDVESQVLTALLSCVKSGLVCALDSGNFRLLEPNPKNMISNCIARVSHGSKCCCINMLKCLLRTYRPSCCYAKNGVFTIKKKPKKPLGKRKPCSPCMRKRNSPSPQKPQAKPVPVVETRACKPSSSPPHKNKCDYCLEIHTTNLRSSCKSCYSSKSFHEVPFDKFSPRDETGTDNSDTT